MKSHLFDDPLKLYNTLLNDIQEAQSSIILEFYRFTGSIGIRIIDALALKAKQGLEVKLLFDSWGTDWRHEQFAPLIQAGGEVRFFHKIILRPGFFIRSHRRNHRKLVIIDSRISYIGSSNISDYNIVWRELILRIEGPVATAFRETFDQMYAKHTDYLAYPNEMRTPIFFRDFEIVRDVPSIRSQMIRRRYTKLIKKARKSIIIETPYFLPSFLVRKALIAAVARGVKVQICIPLKSDMSIVDKLRNRYIGPLTEQGIEFLMHTGHNLHAKLLFVDNTTFAIGSANFDFRSFRFQHEMTLIGKYTSITSQVIRHTTETINQCIPFDYEAWKKRKLFDQFLEWLILPIRHLL